MLPTESTKVYKETSLLIQKCGEAPKTENGLVVVVRSKKERKSRSTKRLNLFLRNWTSEIEKISKMREVEW